jgi:hypothetical protein
VRVRVRIRNGELEKVTCTAGGHCFTKGPTDRIKVKGWVRVRVRIRVRVEG